MSTTTLTPSSDKSVGSNWSRTGGSTYSGDLSDASDSTYGSINSSTSTNNHLQLTLTAIPGNVLTLTAVSIVLRCLAASTKNTPEIAARVWNSTGTTALTSLATVLPTSSFSNISTSVTLSDSTISDWTNAYLDIQSVGDGANTTLEVSEASVVLTVTLASAPGTPTNLVASYASATSVTLTWTQGSGTVTDNKVKYGTDGTTFGTTVDQGSAVTTATITGLTTKQLYFFEVDAENGSGASAYTAPVTWVCGSAWTGQVSQSSDDAYESSGTVTLTDATISPTSGKYAGWRWQNVLLAGGVDVTQATLYLYFSSVSSPANTFSVDCQASTSAATFTTASNNISGRSLTGVTGGAAVGGAGTGWNNFPDLQGAVQAVVNQGGWASGDPIVVQFVGNTGLTGITIEMFDGNSVQAAILAVFTVTAAQWEAAIYTTESSCESAASNIALNNEWGVVASGSDH